MERLGSIEVALQMEGVLILALCKRPPKTLITCVGNYFLSWPGIPYHPEAPQIGSGPRHSPAQPAITHDNGRYEHRRLDHGPRCSPHIASSDSHRARRHITREYHHVSVEPIPWSVWSEGPHEGGAQGWESQLFAQGPVCGKQMNGTCTVNTLKQRELP
jgi:hypothetical protein